GLDVVLDVGEQLRHRSVIRALGDDVEGLEQRHAGFHHRRQLPGEYRDVAIGDLLAALVALLADLRDDDALASQRALHDRLTARAHLAADLLAAAVASLPEIGELARLACRVAGPCGGG